MATPLRRVLASILSAGLAAVWSAGAPAQPQEPPVTHAFAQSRAIPGRYIVVLKDSVGSPAAEAANATRGGGQIHYVYTATLKGFAATLPGAALQALQNNPAVAYIEPDQTVSLTGSQSPATWGLDRIDQADRPLDTVYNFVYGGSGVNAFIIDTGIRADHQEFTGRLIAGYTAVLDGRGTNDCNGHGTHVAGTVGGTTWGVAKQVKLSPVRVLDCRGSGTISGVIAGVEWVADSGPRPAVANMSLGGGKSTSLNSAVAGAVSLGVTMVVAAGNSSADACNYSPSSEPSAITVGATTSSDARAYYSNYGTCLDIFAPGSSITSAWYTSSSATNTISGTSMASPHVAGVAALAVEANPGASPSAIASYLISTASDGKISSVGTGSPNKLVYSLGETAAAEPAPVHIAVTDISGTSTRKGKNWRAQATVTVRDVKYPNAAMANVTVTGSFAPPGSTASCVTAATGNCTLTSAPIGMGEPQSIFTIGNISGTNMVWESGQGWAQISISSP